MPDLPPPDVVALLICDQIITDQMTRKQSLIGLFSTIHCQSFPTVHPQLSVFVALTEGRGETDLTIRIVDSNEAREPLVQGRGRVNFRDPRAVAYLALQFRGLNFPQAGEYRVQLWSGNHLLREARLMAVQAKPRRPGAGPGQQPGEGEPGGEPTDPPVA